MRSISLSFFILCTTATLFTAQHPNKKRTAAVPLAQNTTKKQKTTETLEKSLSIQHHFSSLHFLISLRNQHGNVYLEGLVVPIGKHRLSFQGNGTHVIEMLLPTAPNRIMFPVGNNTVRYGDCISIEQQIKTVQIKNLTSKILLAEFPTQNSCINIGNKRLGEQITKEITIWNQNVSFVAVKNRAYQKPLIGEKNALKNSKRLQTRESSIRSSHGIKIETSGSNQDNRIIDAAIIISAYRGLQKVRIRPYCDAMKDVTKLFVKEEEDGFITIATNTNRLLARICTPDTKMMIGQDPHNTTGHS